MLAVSEFEKSYLNVIHEIVDNGITTENRTGVKASVIFNYCFNIDVSKEIPIVTGKKIFYKKAYTEYLWMIKGMTNTKYLKDNGIQWWNQFADARGDLGKTYGYQIRNFNNEVDQLATLYHELRNNSRRAHITLWNPSELNQTKLPPCYTGFTFVRIGDVLNMSMQFRSSDVFLGLPYDILVGYFMLRDIAEFLELKVGNLGINLANAHLYENHTRATIDYLEAEKYAAPVKITKTEDESIEIGGYKHSAYIKAKLN